jgi:hypothetical protein
MTLNFRKTIFISLLGHLAAFSIFSFSFGRIFPNADYGNLSFWGQILSGPQVNPQGLTNNLTKKLFSFSRRDIPLKAEPISLQINNWHKKPLIPLSTGIKESAPMPKAQLSSTLASRKEPAIIFYPLLPYSFMLYFKDRQIAHVELNFKIEREGAKNSIAVKRKISSGNLEVDLLCQRYISHYLFLQQARFSPGSWQAVKIDLSAKGE